MIRIILGILAGYLGMAIIVMTSILAAAFAVGTDRLIDPQTNQISTWFIIVAEWPISPRGRNHRRRDRRPRGGT